MGDSDGDEAALRQMVERFLQNLVTVHGLPYEEARMTVGSELQREYDRRIMHRRSSFRVIQNNQPS